MTVTKRMDENDLLRAGKVCPRQVANETAIVLRKSDPHWRRGLIWRHTQAGPALLKQLANVATILRHHDDWRDALGFDTFADQIIIRRACPAGQPGRWLDVHDVRTAEWMQTGEFLFGVTPELVVQAVQLVAREIEIDPLREHLCALGWDGRARLDTWLVKYLGVEDTAYAREVGSKFLIGAAARALVPGAKVDSMLVLMGRQGAGKSTVARILARDFFTDELQDLSRPADAAMQLMGRWVVEVAELDALSRAEVSKVKAFLTRSTDRYRKPYGRHVEEHPRRCVFVGTANVDDWQRDETGGRRFWPIKVGPINADGLRADRDQILAEAVARYRDGEPWWLTDIAAIERATEAQATVYSADAWEVPLATWLDTPTVKLRGWVSVPLALEALGLDKGRWGQSEQNRIVRCLRSLRWERKQVRNEAGKREYRYFPSVTTSCTTGDATGDTGRQGKSASVTTVTTVTSSLSRAATAVGGVKGARVVTGAGGDTGDEDNERKAIRENGGG